MAATRSMPRDHARGPRAPDRRADRRPRRPPPVHRLRNRDLRALHRGDLPARARPRGAGRVPVHARRAPRDVPRPPWTMRQYAGFAHRRGVQRALPLPARRKGRPASRWPSTCPPRSAYDSDHPRASGEVGKVGRGDRLARRHAHGCSTASRSDKVSTSMTINAPAPRAAALYVAVGEEQGVPPSELQRHDPERHPQGVHRPRHLHLPARPAMRLIDRHLRVLPRTSAAAGTRSRSPATTSARRAATAVAGGRLHARRRHRLRAGRARAPGWTSTTSRRGSRSSSTPTTTFFEEVAKFRAARRMWAHDHAGALRRQEPEGS